jgi:sugar/nucleoside kinase (ribokinase family)
MAGARVATVGEIVLDEVVQSGGPAPHRQLGGGALYSAIGALTWAARPEVHAVIGSDAPSAELDRLGNAGIDFGHVTRRDGPSLGLWMLYERSGRRQQAPKLDSPTMLEIDLERGPIDFDRAIRGVHIAPQTTEGQERALSQTGDAITRTLDAMVETYIDLEPYRTGAGLRGIEAFLPSVHEVDAIWGPIDPVELAGELFERAGLPWLVITHGSAGVDVVNRDGLRHLPALERAIVDPTGAGDAFAGGFLVGLIETGDPVQAALKGTVSASFVVETRGPLEAVEQLNPNEAARRLRELTARLDTQVKVAHGVEVN